MRKSKTEHDKSDRDETSSLDAFQAAQAATDRFLTEEESALTEVPPVNGKWRGHNLHEAEAGAEMMEKEPTIFEGLGFSAKELSFDQRRLKQLSAARRSLQASLDRIDLAVLYRKGRIAERTGQLRSLVGLRLADPTFKKKRRLQEIAEPMLAISREAIAAQTGAARATLRLKEEARVEQAQAETLGLENKVLKGDKLTVADVRPAAAPRRAGRKTRR